MVNIVAILQHYNTYFWEITLKHLIFHQPSLQESTFPMHYPLFTIKILIIIFLTVCHTIQMT